MTDNLCPACEVGELQACCGESVVRIGSELICVDGIQWMLCTHCYATITRDEQKVANMETVATIRKALEWGS